MPSKAALNYYYLQNFVEVLLIREWNWYYPVS